MPGDGRQRRLILILLVVAVVSVVVAIQHRGSDDAYRVLIIPILIGMVSTPALFAATTRGSEESNSDPTASDQLPERAQCEAIFQTTQDCIFIKDLLFRYVRINPATERLLGLPGSEILGRTDKEVLGDDAATCMRSMDERVIAGEVATDEYTMTIGGQAITCHIIKAPVRDLSGKVTGVCGIARDVTGWKRHQVEQADTLERISRQQAAIVRLATSNILASGENLASAAAILTETAAEALEVDRVGLWTGGPDQEKLTCVDLFDRRSRDHTKGHSIRTDTCPIYLEALASDRVIDASDAHRDPRVAEFNEAYHIPLGVKSALDAPIRIGGKVIGVICHEHHECRRMWRNDEVLFAGQIADQAAQAILNVERRRAEDAIKEREAKLNSIIRAAPIGIGLTIDRQILEVNERLCQMTGYSRDELLNKPGRMLYPSDDEFNRVGREKYAQIEKFGIGSVETRWRRRDGAIIDVILSSSPLTVSDLSAGVTFTAVDITDRKRAENALRESERRFKDILAGINLAALIMDTRGVVTFCNDFMLNISGWQRHEILGRNVFDLFALEDQREGLKEAFAASLASDSFPAHTEITIRTKTGDQRKLDWGNTIIRDKNGEVTGAASLGRDITEQRELERQYQQAQKMEAVGQLAGGVAHDFNNLLQVIAGYSNLLIDEIPDSTWPREELDQIRQAAERAVILVRQLLTFSRRDQTKKQLVSLEASITNIAAMLRRVIGEHIQLKTYYAPDLPDIIADPGHIDQILMNLCVNAKDAMPSGGTIEIRAERANLTRRRSSGIESASPDDFVRLSVSDTGVGMPPDVLARIFEPFFTTKGVGKGTGLGLATVYGIVQQHDGLIDVDSTPGSGTTFRIHFPQAAKRMPTKALHDAGAAGPRRGTETVLLAEDDDQVRNLAVRILERAGYTVVAARDGEEATRLAERLSDQIDIYVLDVVMPGKGGMAVARHTLSMKPDARILFCSGYSHDALAEDQRPSGEVNLLTKPFSAQELLSAVREILDRSAAQTGTVTSNSA